LDDFFAVGLDAPELLLPDFDPVDFAVREEVVVRVPAFSGLAILVARLGVAATV
jgi:hypothetical protein